LFVSIEQLTDVAAYDRLVYADSTSREGKKRKRRRKKE